MGIFSFWSTPEVPASSSSSSDACPVDHKTRAVWLQQQQVQQKQQEQASQEVCPVDPKARSVWLQQQQQKQPALPKDHPPLPPSAGLTTSQSAACSSDTISQSPKTATSPALLAANLSQEREVSSIPRATPTASSGPSPNAETANPETSESGYWIYPSEAQFVQAVLRKNHNTPNTSPENLAETVSSIIPIHNAVNERAWRQIREWESKYATPDPSKGQKNPRVCQPKLLSFKGTGSGPEYDVETPSGVIMSYVSLFDPRTPLTPRARWNAFLGYQAPFDRHDWIVERCDGEKVEYVIDFYQGKASDRGNGRNLNFYLDVRPKFTSTEGVIMRWRKAFGNTP